MITPTFGRAPELISCVANRSLTRNLSIAIMLVFAASASAFEGRINATVTRGGETQTLIYVIGTNCLRIERTETNWPHARNLVNLQTGDRTLLFPHNRSFVRLKPAPQNAASPFPGAPVLPPGIGPQTRGPSGAPAMPNMPMMPQMPAPPAGIGPTNLPGMPSPPPTRQMPAMPQMPAPPPMPQMPAMPATPQMPAPPAGIEPTNLPGAPAPSPMPQMPAMPALPQMPALPAGIGPQPGGASGAASMPAMPGMAGGMPAMPPMPNLPMLERTGLTATGQKTNLLGLACVRYELKQRGETLEVWATDKLFPFEAWQPNQPPRFGPRMLEEQWPELVKAKKLFPLLATLKFENGVERYRFEVKSVKADKITDPDGKLFQPPPDYNELEPLPF